MARVLQGPQYTPESCKEAVVLRAYCESRGFPVGESTENARSVTGQPYSQFSLSGYATARDARMGGQECFDEYAKGKSGTLYWRIVPEIAYGPRRGCHAFYMRLLISDKPVKHG